MTDPTGVLARIDSTIEAWELGPDAARWFADKPEPRFVGILATLDGEYVPPASRPRMWIEGQLLAGVLAESGLLNGLIATMRSACESVLALSRALSLEPWPHSWNEPCFCHPKPFPAARDYRRRTRHRNRRRR